MSSGGTRVSSSANGHMDECLRVSSTHSSGTALAHSGAHLSSTAHKRTASGNPRVGSQPVVEKSHEETRVTERNSEAHVEKFRVTSPENFQWRPVSKTDKRPSGNRRQNPSELRLKQLIVESPLETTWNPVVTLLPHTSAPLACRVSIPALASTVPLASKPKPLDELSLELQEAVVVEDLLFVLMGYEGQYIRYAKDYDPNEERDRLSGPTFRILPGLDPSLHDLTKSILKTASHYSALVAFSDVQSREDFGAVNHALCASVRKLLQDYLVMIGQLEIQFLTSHSFTIHVLNIHMIPTSHMLLQLHSLAQELLKKNGLLDEDESSDGDDSSEDYDKVIERLTDGGDLLSRNMMGKKICKGGVVLGILTKRLERMSGDAAARTLLMSLLREASQPYMMMLNEWLHHGAINDPHSEFLIKEQKSIRRERLEQDYTDEYWERRYTMRDHEVPPQLEGVKAKVLLAGKYLNVVRECGGIDVGKAVADVPTSFDDSRFLDNVNNAYAHANESLMQLLLTTHALPARLWSMKHYFFFDPSDHFSYFLELGASELRKSVKAVNTGKLQSLLDLVLRQPSSVVALDPFKEDVKVEMNEITLTKALQRVVKITGIEQGEVVQPLAANQPPHSDKHATGFTSLQLDYLVPFPVSLVISRKTVWRYQALFRYLLSLRLLEAQLSTTWQTQMRGIGWAHRGPNDALERWKRRAWTLRARMLIFVQQLLYYCTAEVIEPNWTRFMARLQQQQQQHRVPQAGNDEERKDGASGCRTPALGLTRTVDELMQDHVDFLDTCLKECMLTNSKLLRIYSKLMQICTIFATYTNWLTRELEKSDPDLTGPRKPTTMTADQWRRFQASRPSTSSSSFSHHQQQQQQRRRQHDQSAASSLVDPLATTSTSEVAEATDADTAAARVGTLFDIIRKWEANFSRHLQILLDALNHYAATETVVLLSLCARLSTANQGTDYAGLRADVDAST